MLTTVRLSQFAIRNGKKITLSIGSKRIVLSIENPQLDLKGLDLRALEKSLIQGEIRGHVAAKMLSTVQIQIGESDVQTGNPVTAGAAAGAKPLATTDQSTATGPATDTGKNMLPDPAQVAPQIVPGANVVVRNEAEVEVPPVPLKPTPEPVGQFAPDTSKVKSVLAPEAAPAVAASSEEESQESAPEQEQAKIDDKTVDAAPAWKADKTLTQQEAVLNESTDKEFLGSVVSDPNESDRLKLVAEKRLTSLQ
jgi:hypothetical protein